MLKSSTEGDSLSAKLNYENWVLFEIYPSSNPPSRKCTGLSCGEATNHGRATLDHPEDHPFGATGLCLRLPSLPVRGSDRRAAGGVESRAYGLDFGLNVSGP